MNHYAYYGLKCEDDDYAYTKAIPDISFCGGVDLTFSCDIYYKNGYSGYIFYQEDSVWLEVKNGYMSWKNAKNFEVKSNVIDSPLIENAWNHADIVYKGDKLLLYVNRCCVDEMTIKTESIISSNKYIYGHYYPGYIRNIRMADYAFTEDEIIKQSGQTTINVDRLLLYLPFDEAQAEDKGKYKLPLICKGLANCVSLVSALAFEKQGFVALQNSSINPGDKNLPEFSIALRVFLYPQKADNIILFQNQGEREKRDDFVVHLQMNSDKSYLTLELGDFSYQGKNIELVYFEWQSICITVKEKKISCFVNGVLLEMIEMDSVYNRSSEAKWFLGNCNIEEVAFRGAIDYFAVYNKSLEIEYVKKIVEVEPYLYDDNICSLYLFHGESNQDLLGKGVLTYCDVQIKLIEGTVSEKKISNFQFRTNDVFLGNELEAWETDLVLQLCGGVMAAATGLSLAESIPACVQQALVEDIVMMPEAQKLFMSYDKMNTKDITELCGKIMNKPKLKNAIFTAALGGTASSVTILSNEKLMELEILLGTALFVTYFTKIVEKIKDKKKPKNPPYVPFPIPQYGYAVNLQSVQFCNTDRGSIPLRMNFKEKQILPEWAAKKADAAVVAYLAKKQVPVIEIVFSYIPAKDQTSANVSLKGKSDILGEFETEQVTCTSAGEYTVKAELKDFGINETSELGLYSDIIKWSYNSVVGIDTFCNSVSIDIHIIKNEPLAPWSTTDKEHYLTVELLNTIADIKKKTKQKIVDITFFMKAFYEYTHMDNRVRFSTTDRYSAISDESCTDISVQNELICTALISGNEQFGSLDICSICKYLAAMEGFDIQIIGFYGFEYPIYGKSATTIGSCGIWLNPVEAFGVDVTNQITRHYVLGLVESEETEDIKVFDLMLNLKADKEYIQNIAISSYQKKLGASDDAMGLGFIGYYLVEEKNITPLQIVFDEDDKLFAKSTRRDFKQYVRDQYYFPQNLACCHRLSYAVMEEILIDTFNFLGYEESFTKENKDEVLKCLRDAFYEDDTYVNLDANNKIELINHINILLSIQKGDLEDAENCVNIGKRLSMVMYCLNSIEMNLKAGYANWNSSIGVGYDPSDYAMVFDIGSQRYMADQLGNIQQVRSDIPIGIHLVNDIDKRILSKISHIEDVLEKKYVYIYTANRLLGINNRLVSIPYVYSSNNQFAFPKRSLRCMIYDYYL